MNEELIEVWNELPIKGIKNALIIYTIALIIASLIIFF